MNDRKKSFVLYQDTLETAFKMLSLEQRGLLFTGIVGFSRNGDVKPTGNEAVDMALILICEQVRRDNDKYAKKCERLSENAKKRKQSQADESNCEQVKAGVENAAGSDVANNGGDKGIGIEAMPIAATFGELLNSDAYQGWREQIEKNGTSEDILAFAIKKARTDALANGESISIGMAKRYVKNVLSGFPFVEGDISNRKRKFWSDILKFEAAVSRDILLQFFNQYTQPYNGEPFMCFERIIGFDIKAKLKAFRDKKK